MASSAKSSKAFPAKDYQCHSHGQAPASIHPECSFVSRSQGNPNVQCLPMHPEIFSFDAGPIFRSAVQRSEVPQAPARTRPFSLSVSQLGHAGRTGAPLWRRQKFALSPHSRVRSQPPQRSRTAGENSQENSLSASSPQTVIWPVSSISQAMVHACVMKVLEFAGPTAISRSRKLAEGIMSM